jgi:hypothetical protein
MTPLSHKQNWPLKIPQEASGINNENPQKTATKDDKQV